jgi:Domain of unknown function (DUF4864)
MQQNRFLFTALCADFFGRLRHDGRTEPLPPPESLFMKTGWLPPLFYIRRLARMLAMALGACMLLGAAQASALTPTDEKNVRAAVEGQIAALAMDDANKAFSFTAPNVRETVGTATRFLAMVRKHYPMIYRPASIAFLRPEAQNEQVIQRVQMLDTDNNAWLAIYSLQRQKDRAWRITGCKVVANKWRMA